MASGARRPAAAAVLLVLLVAIVGGSTALLAPPCTKARVRRSAGRPPVVSSVAPLKPPTLNRLVPFVATPQQLEWFQGSDDRERFDIAFQGAVVAFLGLWASYFVSFIVGSPLATIIGTGFAFNSLLRPYLLAYQRAVKVRGYDPEVPHIAGLFSAQVLDCKKVKRQSPTSVFRDIDGKGSSSLPSPISSPDLVTETMLTIGDEEGRTLTLRAPRRPSDRRLEPGLRAECIIFSEGFGDFEAVSGATDIYLPEVDTWFGPYPYLDRSEFIEFIRRRERKRAKRKRRKPAT